MQFFGLLIGKPRITYANIRHALEKVTLFPSLSTDENGAFGKGRIVAFRSKEEWLIVFELLVYAGEIDEYVRQIYGFGNNLRNRTHIENLFSLTSDDDVPDPFDFEIFFASGLQHFHFDVDDYGKAGIDLNKPISGHLDFDRRVQILRLLVGHIPSQELFLSPPALLKVLGRPATLALFIELHQWCQTDPRKSESPIASPCLESLIKALAENNPDLYECPANLVNSDWSHWPAFGK